MILTLSIHRESGPSEQAITHSVAFGPFREQGATTLAMYFKAVKQVMDFIVLEAQKVGWLK